MSFFYRLRLLFSRDPRNLYTIKQFAHAHKDFLIIVCDPKSDRIFATYRDRFVNGKIKSTDGKKTKVVKGVLKYSRFDHHIDSFIASIAETLNLNLLKGNQLYQLLDGFLYNIAKSLRKKRAQREQPAMKGSIPSPFIAQENDKK
jgi:hypothetical protein